MKKIKYNNALALAVGIYLISGMNGVFAETMPPSADQMITSSTNKSSKINPYDFIKVTEGSTDSLVKINDKGFIVGAYKDKTGKDMKLYFSPGKDSNFVISVDGNKFLAGMKSANAIGVLANADYGYGIKFDDNVKMLVSATGGDSGANGKANAEAYGIRLNGAVGLGKSDNNNAIFNVIAKGGTGGEANAEAYGIKGDNRTNDGRMGDGNKIIVNAQGGNAYRDSDYEDPVANNSYHANATAFGIDVKYNGDHMTFGDKNEIEATAIGGHGEKAADAFATGFNVQDSGGWNGSSGLNFSNDNKITAVVVGGQVKENGADVKAGAIGINFASANSTQYQGIMNKRNEISAYATAGHAQSGKSIVEATGILHSAKATLQMYDQTVVKAVTVNGDFKADEANAYAVRTKGPGEVKFGFGATIEASAENGNAYALLAEGGKINVNAFDFDYVPTTIKGAVVAKNGGTIDIKLDNKNSILKGMVIEEEGSKINLDLLDSSKWAFANNGKEIKIADDGVVRLNRLTLGNNATIDMTADSLKRSDSWRSLKSSDGNFNIDGENNTIVINSDLGNQKADKIIVDSTKGTNNIRVNYDPYFDGKTTIDNKKVIVVDGAEGGNLTGKFTGSATEYGLNKYIAKLEQNGDDWYLTGFNKGDADEPNTGGTSTTADQINYLSDVTYSLTRSLQSSLNKRLGALRENKEETGAWVRFGRGKNEFDHKNKQQYNIYQGGYDLMSLTKNAKVYRGVFVEYGKANNEYYAGSGESKAKSLGVYQTEIADSGRYYDVVLKGSNVSNNMNVMDLGYNLVTADYKHRQYSASAEYGYRRNLNDGLYYQPQVELIGTRLEGYNYETNTHVKVSQDNSYSLIGRLGVTVGKNLDKKSNVYLTTSLMHEFMGDLDVKAIDVMGDKYNFNKALSETWVQFILGGSINCNSTNNIYFNFEKSAGGNFKTKWQLNLGYRHAF